MNEKISYIFKTFTLICLSFLFYMCQDSKEDGKETDKDKTNNSSEKGIFSQEQDTSEITHTGIIRTTMGKINFVLYGEDAPKTVENFVGLVHSGYYNNILIHRVAKNFLIQTGDGNTKYKSKISEWGIGGKSYFGEEFEDEINPNTPSYKAGYSLGTIAMANKGPNTNTSQFFICLEESQNLEYKWTIFGKVTNGLDIVRKISKVDIIPSEHDKNDGRPVKPIKILSITVKKK